MECREIGVALGDGERAQWKSESNVVDGVWGGSRRYRCCRYRNFYCWSHGEELPRGKLGIEDDQQLISTEHNVRISHDARPEMGLV